MDPVSVFNALYDTKCLKFGRYDLKSGLVAPYYMNLRRLPLYPALMDAIVTQVHERFLSPQAITVTLSQVQRRRQVRSMSTASAVMDSIRNELMEVREASGAAEIDGEERTLVNKGSSGSSRQGADSDSQLGDEEVDGETTSSEDCEWEEVNGFELYNQRQETIISGVPYGAIPLAAAIAYRARLPFLFERKEAKTHGDHQPLVEDFTVETRRACDNKQLTGSTIADPKIDEFSKQKQPPVILIEDVICSGESILEAAERLESQNLRLEFVICIVDREENGTNLLLQKAGIRVLSLYKISAILRVLEATGRITDKQFLEIRQWIAENQFRTIGVNPALNMATMATVNNPSAAAASIQIEVASN